jgi:hypothetical protein
MPREKLMAMLATYSRGVPFVVDISTTLYIKKAIGIGANYRTNKEMAGILSFTSDYFKLGYSYQFGTSSNNIARGFRSNTHEVTFIYRFGNLTDRRLL